MSAENEKNSTIQKQFSLFLNFYLCFSSSFLHFSLKNERGVPKQNTVFHLHEQEC